MSGQHNLKSLIIEWLIWMALIVSFYLQIDSFSQPIAEYRFGADGWPRTVLICLALGATAQLIFSYRAYIDEREKPINNDALMTESEEATEQDSQKNHVDNTDTAETEKQINIWQQIGIFVTPLLYLWCMQRMGFFFITPFFIMVYLLILEVRSIKALLGVTATVYGFVLIVFVRFFYVALPVWHMADFL